jgi:hypothetical protein
VAALEGAPCGDAEEEEEGIPDMTKNYDGREATDRKKLSKPL